MKKSNKESLNALADAASELGNLIGGSMNVIGEALVAMAEVGAKFDVTRTGTNEGEGSENS